MKLYVRTHWIKYVLCFGVSLFVFFLSSLAGSFTWRLTGYFLGLSAFLLFLLFAADYYGKRHLYAFLSGRTMTLVRGDVTRESRIIQERVNDLLGQQEQRLLRQTKAREQQITFMNLWSHQMKTPISVLEMMAEDQPDGLDILKETQRLKSGLSLALNQARLAGGVTSDFVLSRLQLSRVAKQVVNTQKNYFIRHQVYPQLLVADDLLVTSDEKWLSFIIEQVVINGIKYSKAGDTLSIEGSRDHSGPFLIIKDHGVGIPVEDLPRVKHAFFTGENGRHFGEATGMGLYLVEEAAQPLDIIVDIESEVGLGTTVTLRFPNEVKGKRPVDS